MLKESQTYQHQSYTEGHLAGHRGQNSVSKREIRAIQRENPWRSETAIKQELQRDFDPDEGRPDEIVNREWAELYTWAGPHILKKFQSDEQFEIAQHPEILEQQQRLDQQGFIDWYMSWKAAHKADKDNHVQEHEMAKKQQDFKFKLNSTGFDQNVDVSRVPGRPLSLLDTQSNSIETGQAGQINAAKINYDERNNWLQSRIDLRKRQTLQWVDQVEESRSKLQTATQKYTELSQKADISQPAIVPQLAEAQNTIQVAEQRYRQAVEDLTMVGRTNRIYERGFGLSIDETTPQIVNQKLAELPKVSLTPPSWRTTSVATQNANMHSVTPITAFGTEQHNSQVQLDTIKLGGVAIQDLQDTQKVGPQLGTYLQAQVTMNPSVFSEHNDISVGLPDQPSVFNTSSAVRRRHFTRSSLLGSTRRLFVMDKEMEKDIFNK